MSKLQWILFCVIIETIAVKPQRCIGLNEIYLSCGMPCLNTCDNYWIPRLCDRECVPGCFCKEGYVRDSDYRCVLPIECLVKVSQFDPKLDCTRPNEELQVCGTACPDSCDKPNNSWVCTRQCIAGCFCVSGYVRDSEKNCIKPEQCPVKILPSCDEQNEEYKECGTSCPLTCKNYGTSMECLEKCKPGCFCKIGFVRDNRGNCILPHLCESSYIPGSMSIPCIRPHEEYGFGSSCPLTCRTLNSTKICPNHPIEGCFCVEGFVRDDRKNCIRPEDCPPVIPELKITCTLVTEKPKDVIVDEEFSCETQFMYGEQKTEYCQRNVKDVNKEVTKNCTQVIVNPVECYGENEIMACGSPCPIKCKTLGKPCNIFRKSCVQQCYCRRGYARDHRGLCVRTYKCPRSNPSILPLIYRF